MVVVHGVDVDLSEAQDVLDRNEPRQFEWPVVVEPATSVLVGALDIVSTRGHHQRSGAVLGRQRWVGAPPHQESHTLEVSEGGGQEEGCRADDGRRQPVVLGDAARNEGERSLEQCVGVGAPFEQRRDHLRHLLLHGRVKRCASRAGVVGVGATVQQKQRHFIVTAVDRHQQHLGLGVAHEARPGVGVARDPVRSRLVDVGT